MKELLFFFFFLSTLVFLVFLSCFLKEQCMLLMYCYGQSDFCSLSTCPVQDIYLNSSSISNLSVVFFLSSANKIICVLWYWKHF